MKPGAQAGVDLKGCQDSWFQHLVVYSLYVCGLLVCMFLCVSVCTCTGVRTTAGQKCHSLVCSLAWSSPIRLNGLWELKHAPPCWAYSGTGDCEANTVPAEPLTMIFNQQNLLFEGNYSRRTNKIMKRKKWDWSHTCPTFLLKAHSIPF